MFPSPPPKAAPPPKPVEGEAAPVVVAPPPPETFTIGVTNLAFNPTNAIFGRLLRTKDGHIVTQAYWYQKESSSHDEIPYYEKNFNQLYKWKSKIYLILSVKQEIIERINKLTITNAKTMG
mgnify:CR=1 FL=1